MQLGLGLAQLTNKELTASDNTYIQKSNGHSLAHGLMVQLM